MTPEERLIDLRFPTHDSWGAKWARWTHPAHDWCRRCGMPWARVPEHPLWVGNGHGLFVLCETCWHATPSCGERSLYFLSHPHFRESVSGARNPTWDEIVQALRALPDGE